MRRKDIKALNEDQLWEAVAEEIDSDVMRKGLWLKALSETDNDRDRAKAVYAKLRVEQLSREIEFEHQVAVADEAEGQLSGAELKREIRTALEKATKSPVWLGKK